MLIINIYPNKNKEDNIIEFGGWLITLYIAKIIM